jgi:Arylsulfotransferase (ASST)
VLPDGAISIFDNGGSPKVHEQSRGIIMRIDRHAGTAAVVAQYEHSSPLLSASQGNLQLLRGGDAFIGWGSEPYFSEFDSSGNTVFDARFRGPYQSYRGYTFSWTGAPAGPPSVAAVRSVATGATRAYASWNGDTRTARWRVLTGSSPRALTPGGTVARAGFETTIALPGRPAFLAVQALDAAGAVLGRSRTVRG